MSVCVSRGVTTPDVYLASLIVVLIVFPFILTRSSNTKSLYGKSVYEELTWRFVSLYIMRCSNMGSLYGKSMCAELTRGFVSLYITRSSNTKSRYGKSMCEKLTWKICYLICHAVIEHRAGTREDISCWHWWLLWSENNHLWQSFYCIFIIFPFGGYSWSSGHLPHLYYLIIWRENWRELPGESWVPLYFSGFIFWFMFTLWWVVFTRCSINRADESILFEWTFVTGNWWEITRDVWFIDEGISSRVCL